MIGARQRRADRVDGLFALSDRPVVADDQGAHFLRPVLLRKRIAGRHGLQPEEAAERLVWLAGRKVAVPAHDGRSILELKDDRPAVHHARGMGPEQEAGHHAEIAAAAAKRPEEVRVYRLARSDKPTVGQHDVGLDQTIDGEPVLAAQIAVTAGKREASDAGGRDDAKRHSQSERVRRVIDLSGQAARGDPRSLGRRIDPYALHHRKIDNETIIDAAEPGSIMAAATYGDGQILLAAEVHSRDHIGRVGAARDQMRPLVDHRVIKLARLIVFGVVAADKRAAQALREFRNSFLVHDMFVHDLPSL